MEKKILIIEDDSTVIEYVQLILENEGFRIHAAHDGKTGLEKVPEIMPDLILLDVDLPVMNGFQVCAAVRENILYRHIPIIMLTATRKDVRDKIQGLNLGADDYMLKPFHSAELVARVKTTIFRNLNVIESNPLTRLPGNTAILKKLNEIIEKKEDFALFYLDLNKFKAFNDYYGFVRGDMVILLLKEILVGVITKYGNGKEFIGHVGGDDFVIITTPDKAETLAPKIITEFDQRASTLYDNEDVEKGYIFIRNRQGKEEKFPLMSIAIGVVTNKQREIKHPGQISAIAAEVKNYAKTFGKSHYVVDRRKD